MSISKGIFKKTRETWGSRKTKKDPWRYDKENDGLMMMQRQTNPLGEIDIGRIHRIHCIAYWRCSFFALAVALKLKGCKGGLTGRPWGTAKGWGADGTVGFSFDGWLGGMNIRHMAVGIFPTGMNSCGGDVYKYSCPTSPSRNILFFIRTHPRQ